MSEMQKCDKLKIVMACAALIVCIIVGALVFPLLMKALGVPSTFTCHCIGGAVGLFGGILFIRRYIY